MSNQNFNERIGQVAGNDIHNYYSYGVDELSTRNRGELVAGRAHCLERLANARKRLIFNPVIAWFVCATVIMVTLIVTGYALSHGTIFGFVLLFGIGAPQFFYIPITRKYGPMVKAYREGVSRIEFVLHSRGWE